ncbi:PH domain-containing protein [Clostridium felsineum]|uniref:PH domain-containing protein n=1 Tax=Clostridium felsineum TaxID=36839 RepID=UPI00098C3E69|nr:PH domain-containing protein [Clostridium felsineum]URZ17045.1 hypothetical protein CLFE_030970 [Clostridium felsineum DSM 794]
MINDKIIEETIAELLDENDLEVYYCYGIVFASLGKKILFGDFAILGMKYYILTFTNNKLIMTKMSMAGKLKESKTIEYKHIKEVKISTWIVGLGKKVTIKFDDASKVKFSIYGRVRGIKKQGENLKNICKILIDKFGK